MNEWGGSYPLTLQIRELGQTQTWRTPELVGKKGVQVFLNARLQVEGKDWRLDANGEYLIFTAMTMIPKDVLGVEWVPVNIVAPSVKITSISIGESSIPLNVDIHQGDRLEVTNPLSGQSSLVITGEDLIEKARTTSLERKSP